MRNDTLRLAWPKTIVYWLLISSCWAWAIIALADTASTEQLPDSQIENWTHALDRIAADLQRYEPDDERIEQLNHRLNALLNEAEQAKKQAQQALQGPRSELEVLGPEPQQGEPAEATEISSQRRQINDTIATIEARVKQADLTLARGEELLTKISNAHRTRLQTHLLQRGPNAFYLKPFGNKPVLNSTVSQPNYAQLSHKPRLGKCSIQRTSTIAGSG